MTQAITGNTPGYCRVSLRCSDRYAPASAQHRFNNKKKNGLHRADFSQQDLSRNLLLTP